MYFYTPPLEHMTDDDIVKSALDAVHEVYGPAPEPDFVELFHYRRGLSIANPGYYARLDSLHAEMPPASTWRATTSPMPAWRRPYSAGELAANRLTGPTAREPSPAAATHTKSGGDRNAGLLPPGQRVHPTILATACVYAHRALAAHTDLVEFVGAARQQCSTTPSWPGSSAAGCNPTVMRDHLFPPRPPLGGMGPNLDGDLDVYPVT